MAFQVDQSYSVKAIFYAQRSGSNPLLDKITELDIWTTNAGPFTAGDPGTPADAVVPITDTTGAQWEYYFLPSTLTGQYFLIEIQQNPTAGGNIGGNQFRLGGAFTPTLGYSSSAGGLTLSWPVGVAVTLQQAPTVSGPWTSATGITNGVPTPFPALGNQQTFYRLQY